MDMVVVVWEIGLRKGFSVSISPQDTKAAAAACGGGFVGRIRHRHRRRNDPARKLRIVLFREGQRESPCFNRHMAGRTQQGFTMTYGLGQDIWHHLGDGPVVEVVVSNFRETSNQASEIEEGENPEIVNVHTSIIKRFMGR